MPARIIIIALVLALMLTSSALAYGSYPIYGIHFAGPGKGQGEKPDMSPDEQIKNGKPMYSLEMFYTQSYKGKVDSDGIRDIVSRGFRVILRLDYSIETFSIPKKDDIDGLNNYSNTCGRIANDLKDVVHIYVIGNELGPYVSEEYPSNWYAKVFDACYKEIHKNDPSATVCVYGVPGGAADDRYAYWLDVIDKIDKADGFALHSYSGPTFWNNLQPGPTEDPRFADVMGFKNFARYCEEIYRRYGARKSVYITESNTYWLGNLGAELTYIDNWIKHAFKAVDQWNKSNDIKIDALCWYLYYPQWKGGDQWENALWRTDNEKLNRAREDFAWVTANTDYRPGYPGSTLHFEAENFTNSAHWETDKNSIEGTDYFDTTDDNLGGAYRIEPKEQVDIRKIAECEYAVTHTDTGEWLRYRTCAGGRDYKIKIRYSRKCKGISEIYFTVGNSKASKNIALPSTDGNFEVAYCGTFTLERGCHDIKLHVLEGGFDVDWFEFVPVE